MDVVLWEKVAQLEERRTILHPEEFGLVAPCHDASVVVGKNNDRLVNEVGSKSTLATHIAVVNIHKSIHTIVTLAHASF